MDAKDNQQLLETLTARARGEVDFALNIATVLQVPWKDALSLYPELFNRESETVLARVTAAHERRKGAR